jgi:hypothetical protein
MRQTKRLLSLTAVLLIAACTDNSITNPLNDVSGTYQLTVFANHSLPYTYNVSAGTDSELPNGGTVRATDGSLVMNENGTFVETNNFIKTPTGGQSFASSFVSTGTYTVTSAGDVTLNAPAQNGYAARFLSGTWDIDMISYVESGLNFEYRR